MTFDPISRSRHFLKSNIVKTIVLKTKLLLHNGKLYQTYGMVLCLVTLTDLQAWSPARLPAQLNAPHAHQSARFTACSASRRPAGSLRQAVLLNAAPAGSLAGALKLNAPQPRPLASGEDAAANSCWSSYNSCQWVSDMVRFCGYVAGCIILWTSP